MISLTVTTYDSRRLDLSEVIQTVEVETQRFDAPGRMTFTTLEASGIEHHALVVLRHGKKALDMACKMDALLQAEGFLIKAAKALEMAGGDA